MKDVWKLITWVGIPLALSGFIAWLFWGPIRGFCFSCIPSTAEHAWVGKLICLFLIGWGGGIGLPIGVFFLGIMFMAHALD